MIQARCPNCGTLNQVTSDQAHVTVCCYVCRHVFPAAAAVSGGTPSWSAPSTPSPPGGVVTPPTGAYGAAQTWIGTAGAPIPPHLAPSGVAGAPVSDGGGGTTSPGGVLPVEAAASGAATSEEGTGGLLMILVLLAALFVVLGSTVLVLLLFAGGQFSVVPGKSPDQATENLASVHWTDASEKSLEVDDACVRIDRVEWDFVRGRDRNRRVIASGEKYLSVILSVENLGRSPIPYESWHSGPYPAVLRDEQDRVFDRFSVSRFRSIEWHVPQGVVEWQQRLDDRLVFIIPPEVNRDLIAAFRLELPAQAIGREGVLRFRIPTEMIDGY